MLRVSGAGSQNELRSAMPESRAFLAKFFSFFVSFVCFCKTLLVAALPRCSAIPKNCAFLAKFFLLFVSFVCFCKILLVAALPRCSAIPKNCAFLAKFFLLFVSFVCFCKILLVAALPRQALASLREIIPRLTARRAGRAATTAAPTLNSFSFFFGQD
jgi:hypothetical protein